MHNTDSFQTRVLEIAQQTPTFITPMNAVALSIHSAL